MRECFGHKPERFEEFRKKYLAELRGSPTLDQLKSLNASHPKVTLLYAAHDAEHNQAVVLRDFLNQKD